MWSKTCSSCVCEWVLNRSVVSCIYTAFLRTYLRPYFVYKNIVSPNHNRNNGGWQWCEDFVCVHCVWKMTEVGLCSKFPLTLQFTRVIQIWLLCIGLLFCPYVTCEKFRSLDEPKIGKICVPSSMGGVDNVWVLLNFNMCSYGEQVPDKLKT